MRGKVIYVGKLGLTGNVVVIDHGFGLRSLYAHLSETLVENGAFVEKGQKVGVCGKTGFTKDLNLHFGLYVYDVPVSPYSVMDNGMQMTDYTAPEV
jgi:murein DD-endopeptidase MepM/ murein hydrolase activator NlpD